MIDANYAALEQGAATGIQHDPNNAHELYEAIRRTIHLYNDDKTWKRIQRRGMKSDVSWDVSAKRYADLYADLTGQPRSYDNSND